VYEAMMTMRHEVNIIAQTPTSSGSSYGTPSGHSPEWEFVYGDGSIPEPKRVEGPVASDVMALGDVSRDPTKPVAGYIPPTKPQSGSRPFPMLDGPMG
jgi:hypothetical protein